jgi:hypothetical protein
MIHEKGSVCGMGSEAEDVPVAEGHDIQTVMH